MTDLPEWRLCGWPDGDSTEPCNRLGHAAQLLHVTWPHPDEGGGAEIREPRILMLCWWHATMLGISPGRLDPPEHETPPSDFHKPGEAPPV